MRLIYAAEKNNIFGIPQETNDDKGITIHKT